MLIVHGNVCRLECSLEGLEGCPRVTVTAACCAVKLGRPIQFGCVNRQVACRYECVDAYSTAHNVVADSVGERVLRFRFRKLHVGVADCFQSRVEEEFVVEKI